MPPKTVKDYQSALARMGVPLPAGKAKLADYEALYANAMDNENVEPTNVRRKSLTKNTPLSMQTPSPRPPTRTIPLSQQTPTVHVPSPPVEDTPAPDEHEWSPEPAARPQRKRWALAATAVLLLGGAALVLPKSQPATTVTIKEPLALAAPEEHPEVSASAKMSSFEAIAPPQEEVTEEEVASALAFMETAVEEVASTASPPPPPVQGDDTVPTVGRALFGVLRALAARLLNSAQELSVTITQSESLRWLAASALDGWWVLMTLILKACVDGFLLLLSATFDLLQQAIPWMVQHAPGACTSFLSLCIERPEFVGATMAVIGGLHLIGRITFYCGRWREEKRAGRAAQIDAAARWVLCELRAHDQRWTSVSGTAQPVPPSELRPRVPHAILADRGLWKEVATRVSADSCVVVTKEGWLIAPEMNSPMASPGSMMMRSPFSPNNMASPQMMSPMSPMQ